MTNNNSVNRQLPGVKGQWILCSDCPPTEEWADSAGQVQTYSEGDPWGAKHLAVENVMPTIYWRPTTYIDTRPLTPPAAPTQPLKGNQIPEDLLLEWVECHEPWATWMRPGGCLESARHELTALLRKAIAAADVGRGGSVSQPEQPTTIAATSKPKLAVGQVWRRVDGKIITIIKYDEVVDRSWCSEGYVYQGDGKAYTDNGNCVTSAELVELMQDAPKESVDQQAASTEKIKRDIEEFLFSDSGIIFAKANDGTIWRLFEKSNPAGTATDIFWAQLPPLPTHQIQSNG